MFGQARFLESWPEDWVETARHAVHFAPHFAHFADTWCIFRHAVLFEKGSGKGLELTGVQIHIFTDVKIHL